MKKLQRILAILGVVLLLALYASTMIANDNYCLSLFSDSFLNKS
jgi:hypothetical protein